MKNRCVFCLAMLLAVSFGEATQAGIVEDFRFDDTNGTVITDAVNSANAGNMWLSQNTAISAGTLNGSFRIQKGSESTPVTGQVSNSFDIANVTSGKVWLVAELAGWSYTSTASSPSERVRFGFLQNDPPAANSSTITAEATIDRSGNALALNGGALGFGSSNVAGSYSLPLVQSDPFKIVLELDKDANMYTVYYQDGVNAWASLGSGSVGDVSSASSTGTLRDGNAVRFAFTGTYIDTDGEFVDVDRIYVTNMNPIPEPATVAFITWSAIALFTFRRPNH